MTSSARNPESSDATEGMRILRLAALAQDDIRFLVVQRRNRGLSAACSDFPCHSERSIEDAESKNPLLFDGTAGKSGGGPVWSPAPTGWGEVQRRNRCGTAGHKAPPYGMGRWYGG